MSSTDRLIGNLTFLPPDADLLILDVRKVFGGYEYLCEWWVLGTQFRCWVPESRITAIGSGEGPGSVARA